MGQRKYFNIGAGWFKKKRNDEEYISCKAGNQKPGIKLIAQFEDGTTRTIESFACFFEQEKQNPNGPDVRFVFSVDE